MRFVDDMLSATPFEVVADFFPSLGALDKFDHVEVLDRIPVSIICGTADRLTSIGHSRKLARPHPQRSRLLECEGAGHMVTMERHDQVNAELDQLITAADDPWRAPDEHCTVRRVGAESAAVVLAIIQDAFGNRPAAPPARRRAAARPRPRSRPGSPSAAACVAALDGEPVGALLLDAVGDSVYLRRFGVLSARTGHGVAGAMIQAAVEAWTGRAPRLRRRGPRGAAPHRRLLGAARLHPDRPPLAVRRARLRPCPTFHEVAPPRTCARSGARIADYLVPGDLVVLTGDLGAGKTTFTQGLGRGLGVEGAVTSPTFVIAREHALARSTVPTSSTSTPTASAAPPSSTTSTSTPPSTTP